MKKTSSITQKAAASHQRAFEEIVDLIEQSRLQAVKAVNTTLIDLYWNVGKYISSKIQSEGWGKGTVLSLAAFVQKRQPGIRGFSPQNIWRMRQFCETYRDQPILSPLLRELPWSSNLHILSRSKRPEEREFYLKMASRNHWQVREVARQMDAALFERSLLHPPKLSTVLRELHPQAADVFKDIYSLEFLGLPAEHDEADLHRSLLRNLGRFITELGRDFCFIGSEHPLQVGGQDFALDLLFFHRGLNCLIAIELKVREFRPEDLGKLNFYLEALDRDHRKTHENPSIGLLGCFLEGMCQLLLRFTRAKIDPVMREIRPGTVGLRNEKSQDFRRSAPGSAAFRLQESGQSRAPEFLSPQPEGRAPRAGLRHEVADKCFIQLF